MRKPTCAVHFVPGTWVLALEFAPQTMAVGILNCFSSRRYLRDVPGCYGPFSWGYLAEIPRGTSSNYLFLPKEGT
eukprot:3881606-Rhodomonas_salina.1